MRVCERLMCEDVNLSQDLGEPGSFLQVFSKRLFALRSLAVGRLPWRLWAAMHTNHKVYQLSTAADAAALQGSIRMLRSSQLYLNSGATAEANAS
jgi:hypothetical protein